MYSVIHQQKLSTSIESHQKTNINNKSIFSREFKIISCLDRSITAQPYSDNITNTFGPVDNEAVQKIYVCEVGCSRCCGPKMTNVLTNKRLLSRYENVGCCRCASNNHSDASLFLENVEVMREAANHCTWMKLLRSCFTCTCVCFILSYFCRGCCCDNPQDLELAVGYGYETFTFKEQDFGMATMDVTRAIMAAKGDKGCH